MMVVSIGTFVLAIVVTHVISFVLLSLLYGNPLIRKIYDKYKDEPVMKKVDSPGKWMLSMFIFGLFEVLFAGLIFYIAANVLPGSGWLKGLYFGLLLSGVRVYSRFVNMYLLTSYPNSLHIIEFVNGVIGSIVMGLRFSYFLPF